VFGAILDADRGGRFSLRPSIGNWTSKQLSIPDTNVLITRFLTADGVGEVEDFVPIGELAHSAHRQRLIRRVVGGRGEMHFEIVCVPRFDYGRQTHRVERHRHGVVFESPDLRLALETDAPIEVRNGDVYASFALSAGETATFVLERLADAYEPSSHSPEEMRELVEGTVAYWAAGCPSRDTGGRWREVVERSALTLKLLTYQPTGRSWRPPPPALPEVLGGERNWTTATPGSGTRRSRSTRCCGSDSPRRRRRSWSGSPTASRPIAGSVPGRSTCSRGSTAVVSSPSSSSTTSRRYRGSAPVRIGNDAAAQLQLDIYGELVDSIYLYNKYGKPISHDSWEDLSRIVEWVSDHWDQADEGIWETRGGRQPFTYSRLLCWVALKRALRIANTRGLRADRIAWGQARDRIYRQIIARGWHEGRQAFVQHYDTEVLDSSLLLMLLVKFPGADRPALALDTGCD